MKTAPDEGRAKYPNIARKEIFSVGELVVKQGQVETVSALFSLRRLSHLDQIVFHKKISKLHFVTLLGEAASPRGAVFGQRRLKRFQIRQAVPILLDPRADSDKQLRSVLRREKRQFRLDIVDPRLFQPESGCPEEGRGRVVTTVFNRRSLVARVCVELGRLDQSPSQFGDVLDVRVRVKVTVPDGDAVHFVKITEKKLKS